MVVVVVVSRVLAVTALGTQAEVTAMALAEAIRTDPPVTREGATTSAPDEETALMAPAALDLPDVPAEMTVTALVALVEEMILMALPDAREVAIAMAQAVTVLAATMSPPTALPVGEMIPTDHLGAQEVATAMVQAATAPLAEEMTPTGLPVKQEVMTAMDLRAVPMARILTDLLVEPVEMTPMAHPGLEGDTDPASMMRAPLAHRVNPEASAPVLTMNRRTVHPAVQEEVTPMAQVD